MSDFDPKVYFRVQDIHGMVHFARHGDPYGSVACGYHLRHLDEPMGQVIEIGQEWPGNWCPECHGIFTGKAP